VLAASLEHQVEELMEGLEDQQEQSVQQPPKEMAHEPLVLQPVQLHRLVGLLLVLDSAECLPVPREYFDHPY
jgi:hypothetical protein